MKLLDVSKAVMGPNHRSRDSSIAVQDIEKDGDTPHLLKLAREIREKIYDFIIYDIQNTRSVAWNHKTCTSYDSLRLVCRQLYAETYHRVFTYMMTVHQSVKLFTHPMNKQTYRNLRTLTFELEHNANAAIYTGFREALHCLQLTVQELHLIFVGKDGLGMPTAIHGCGNLTHWRGSCQSYQSPLLLTGQKIDGQRFGLYHQLSLMRQLRVLRVRNANLPLNQSMILVNKPHLQALSAVCDPRTAFHTYTSVPRSLLRGLMTVTKSPPAVKVLELTANAVVPASGMVIKLASTLEHLTWIIPHFEYQLQAGSELAYDFYEELGYLIHSLAWRASHLSLLRLCVSMREASGVSTVRTERDRDVMAANFRRYLPQFQRLQHLELHYSGGAGFFRTDLIAYLPASLRRLYISDNTIAPLQLQDQVWQRYFRPMSQRVEGDDDPAVTPMSGTMCSSDDERGKPTRRSGDLAHSIVIIVDQYGWVHYLSEEDTRRGCKISMEMLTCHRIFETNDDDAYLAETDQILGEHRLRGDSIALDVTHIGRLGCISYDYRYCRTDDDDFDTVDKQRLNSDTAIILRLSGKLLDRERHMHLRYDPSLEVIEGIRPPSIPHLQDYAQPLDQSTPRETAQFSTYTSIHSAIYDLHEHAPKRFLVEENDEVLSACLGEHWYFGSEDEAMRIFELEPPAKVEFQRPTSMLEIVDYACDKKCRWMSPDYRIDPVGSFPAPVIPSDWQPKAYK